MKILFTHSIIFLDNSPNVFQKYFDNNGISYFQKSFPKNPSEINLQEAKDLYFENKLKLKKADIVLAEISYISRDTGYFISEALRQRKPVIAMYNMTTNKTHPRHIRIVPIGLKGNDDKYLILKEYDFHNFEKILDLALKDAKDLLGSKFNFITTPEIDKYLEWVSKEEGESKSNILRNLIEDSMSNNVAYQNYLKEN